MIYGRHGCHRYPFSNSLNSSWQKDQRNATGQLYGRVHSKFDASRYIFEKGPTYPRYLFIDTWIKDNLQQNRSTTHQSNNFISTICATLGNRLILLDVVNTKAVCRMSQIFQPSLFSKTLILQLIAQDPVHFELAKY